MAAKLVILAAAMAAMVVLTHATVQTTVITTEVEEGSSNQMGRCRRQLRGQWPDGCEQYLMEKMRYGPGRRYGRGMEEANQERHFDECCRELRLMRDPECQCEAMEMMMEEMRTRQEAGMSRQVMDMAMELPMMCGTMQHRCRMSYMM